MGNTKVDSSGIPVFRNLSYPALHHSIPNEQQEQYEQSEEDDLGRYRAAKEYARKQLEDSQSNYARQQESNKQQYINNELAPQSDANFPPVSEDDKQSVAPQITPGVKYNVDNSIGQLPNSAAKAKSGYDAYNIPSMFKPSYVGAGSFDEEKQAIQDYKDKSLATNLDRQLLGADFEQIQNELMRRNQEDYKKYGEYGKRAEAEFNQANDALARANANVKELKVDYDSFYKRMPSFVKAINMVTVALSGVVSGLSGNKIPNQALNTINKAVERDIRAQKQAISEAMRNRYMAKEQYQMAQGALDNNLKRYKTAANEIAKIQIAKVNYKLNDAAVNDASNKLILKLDSGLSKDQRLAKSRAAEINADNKMKSMQLQGAMLSKMRAEGMKDDKAASEKARAFVVLRRKLSDVGEKFKKLGGTEKAMSTAWDTQAMTEYKQAAKNFQDELTRERTGAALNESELKYYSSLLPSVGLFGKSTYWKEFGGIQVDTLVDQFDEDIRSFSGNPAAMRTLNKMVPMYPSLRSIFKPRKQQ